MWAAGARQPRQGTGAAWGPASRATHGPGRRRPRPGRGCHGPSPLGTGCHPEQTVCDLWNLSTVQKCKNNLFKSFGVVENVFVSCDNKVRRKS